MRSLNLFAIMLAACTSPEIVIGNIAEVTSLKAIPNRDLDVLFVVDNSPSMTDKQMSLAQNFPQMIDVLDTLDGGLPNVHIGVVTSDMGTTGSLAPTMPAPALGGGPGACSGVGDDGALVQGANVTGRFISDILAADGTRTRNYGGELGDAFTGAALVGDNGCGFEQHLRSMERALDGNATNAGFRRPTANLAVVILADEDDCSVADPAFFSPDTSVLGPLQSFRCFQFGVACSPDDPTTPGAKSNCKPRTPASYIDDVQPFADVLLGVAGDPRTVMVAGVVGDPTPVAVEIDPPLGGGTPIPALSHSCAFTAPDSSIEVADPALRIATFLDAFPGRSTLTSICNADLSGALGQIGDSAKKLIGDPCIDTSLLADTLPDPGIQPACEVVDIRDSAPDTQLLLPACTTAGIDCFELVADPVACPATADHLRVRIDRSTPVADDTWTHVRCQLAQM